MFFRRARQKQLTFQDRLEAAKSKGFTVSAIDGGRVRVSRGPVAAVLEDAGGTPRVVERAGIVMGGEIGALVDGGFQKFFQTPSGKRKPALADELEGHPRISGRSARGAGDGKPLQRIAGHGFDLL